MKRIYLLLLGFVVLSLSSCGDEEATNVDLVFQANYGNEILEFNKEYTQIGGIAFEITRSDFFISDVRLTKDDGSEVTIFDYAQVDFEKAPGGTRLTSSNAVSPDNYESITFGIGVNSTNNAKEPKDFEADDVLNNSGYYWSAWDSYIFSKQEGKFDSDGDGTLDEGWIVHTGKDEIYKEVTIALDKKISMEDNVIRLILDHEPLFSVDGEPMEFGLIHDPTNKEAFEGFYNRIRTNIVKE